MARSLKDVLDRALAAIAAMEKPVAAVKRKSGTGSTGAIDPVPTERPPAAKRDPEVFSISAKGLVSKSPAGVATPAVRRDRRDASKVKAGSSTQRGNGSHDRDLVQTMPRGDEWSKRRPAKVVRSPANSPPRYLHLQEPTVLPPPVSDAMYFRVEPEADLGWRPDRSMSMRLLTRSVDLGRRTQLNERHTESHREVILGIDFGTSSTKVVIGDRGLKQSYAVPFRDAAGINAYLLPARLFEGPEGYSLENGPLVHADLKLSLLAKPDDILCRSRVVGFLALTIRLARAWLFDVHRESYAKTDIIWTLALGQPADLATSGPMTKSYELLGHAAWIMAGSNDPITASTCQAMLHGLDAHPDTRDGDLEVKVMPEIAAQVFGFVTSNQFDPKKRNIYLLADVGAGTVDACLFEVKPAPGGNWSFNLYTTAVEPNGVMNLHRERVAWWQSQLGKTATGKRLVQELEAIRLSTEHQGPIPDSFDQYLRGVTVSFVGKARGPDAEFFEKQLVKQIKGRALYAAFSRRLLQQKDLSGVPFFLCGGGSRLDFYRGLNDALRRQYGYTWLSAEYRELALPSDLRADGIVRSDFDRLSVAYGLSMLNLAGVTAVMPPPPPEVEAYVPNWRSHYVDKDQC